MIRICGRVQGKSSRQDDAPLGFPVLYLYPGPSSGDGDVEVHDRHPHIKEASAKTHFASRHPHPRKSPPPRAAKTHHQSMQIWTYDLALLPIVPY